MKCGIALIIFGVGLVVSIAEGKDKVRYDKHKVYRFIPKTEKGRQSLLRVQKKFKGVQFWQGVAKVDVPVDIQIGPKDLKNLTAALSHKEDITTSILIEDVQKLLDAEDQVLMMANTRSSYDWNTYRPLKDMYRFLDTQAAKHSSFAKIINIGKSTENRDLKVIEIAKPGKENKPVIWIDSLIHAREWITGAVCTYLVNELLNSKDPKMAKLREDFDWYILCVVNPDGYVFTHQHDRMWRKTRSKIEGSRCRGVDANRNWGYKWNSGGSSNDPCDTSYHGPSAFSEPETKAVSDFYTTLADRAVLFITIHSYMQMVLLPFGHSNKRYPDYDEYMRICTEGTDALAKRYKTEFQVGNIVDVLHPASGGSIDWVKGVYNTSLVFAMELRDKGKHGFVLPANQIKPSALEFMDFLHEIIKQLRNRISEENND